MWIGLSCEVPTLVVCAAGKLGGQSTRATGLSQCGGPARLRKVSTVDVTGTVRASRH